MLEKQEHGRAKSYQRSGRVTITDSEYKDKNNFEINGIVTGSEPYATYISVKNGEVENITCECPDYYNYYGVCKHTLATMLEFVQENKPNITQEVERQNRHINNYSNTNKYRNFNQIMNTFYNEELEEIDQEEEKSLKDKGTIRLEPKIIYDKFNSIMKIEFKIGSKRMYKLKNLAEFYTRMIEKEFFKYGEKLQFVHARESFEDESKLLLDFVMKYAEIIKYANSNSNSNYRYYGKALSESSIILGNSGLDDLFEVLKGRNVEIQRDYISNGTVEFTDEQPRIEFKLKKIDNEQYVIEPNVEIYRINILIGKNYKYILDENKLYRCTKEFEKTNLKLLELFKQNYITDLALGKEELTRIIFCNYT